MESGPQAIVTDLVLKISADNKYIQAQFSASTSREPIEQSWLLQQIRQHGFDHARLNKDAINQCINQYNSGTTNATINIADCLDGELQLEISDDKLQAFVIISPAQGGQTINSDGVSQALQERGVVFGILSAAIIDAVNKADTTKMLVAQGKPAVNGKDGYFENLLPDIKDRRPRIDDRGVAFYNDIETFVTVKENDPLIRRHLATGGQPGTTITGEPIGAFAGEDVMFAPNLPGTKLAADDPNLLLAAIAGQPVIVENGGIVEPTISVNNVDAKTGNIEFDGSVYVTGDVTTGMKIIVSGDVHIKGMIEEATTVNAGGDILIKNGVIGRGSVFNEEGNPSKGVVNLIAGGNISAKFIENTIAKAGKNITAEELIVHSDIQARGNVIVGKQGAKRGHIMGGSVHADLLIQAEVLGSQASVNTSLNVGIDTNCLQQLDETNKLLTAKSLQRQTLEKTYAVALRAQTVKNNKTGYLINLQATLQKIDNDMQALQGLQAKYQLEIDRLKSAKIIVKQKIYNAVEMHIFTANDRASEEKPGGTFYFENKMVAYKSL